MVIDELLKSGDSLRAGMQIADSINAAKAKLIYLVFEEFEKQLAGVAERNHWTREKKSNWYEYKEQADEFFYKWNTTCSPDSVSLIRMQNRRKDTGIRWMNTMLQL